MYKSEFEEGCSPLLVHVLSLPLSSGSSKIALASKFLSTCHLHWKWKLCSLIMHYSNIVWLKLWQFICTNPNQKRSSCSLPLLIKVLSLLVLNASTSLAPFDKIPMYLSLTSPSSLTRVTSCYSFSHHQSYIDQVIWNKCWQTSQPNNVQTGPSP